jgi:hypothetical protein
VALSDYHYKIVYKKAEMISHADTVSRNPLEDTIEVENAVYTVSVFPEIAINVWRDNKGAFAGPSVQLTSSLRTS